MQQLDVRFYGCLGVIRPKWGGGGEVLVGVVVRTGREWDFAAGKGKGGQKEGKGGDR